jgi:hypothetical protein
MSGGDAWEQLNSYYSNDDIARFEVVLDGLQDAVERLDSERISDLRIALVVCDYLTDVLLTRRVARLISLSEHDGFPWDAREQFDSKTRGLLRQRFNRRLKLAARRYEMALSMGLSDPIMNEDDSETLRVAHASRNDVYHEESGRSSWEPSTRLSAHGPPHCPRTPPVRGVPRVRSWLV